MSFNPSQLTAIHHTSGPALVLAGPGSGKTTVITERTRYLIEHEHIDGSHILVITFTRAAAAEMQERFQKLMNGAHTGVSFGTFHSIFYRILKASYGFQPSNIITSEEQNTYLREIIDRMNLDIADEAEFLSDLLGEISSIKSNAISLSHYYSKCCSEDVFRTIYSSYSKKLQETRKIDFDDILVMSCELLSSRPDICRLWHEKFQYILIDEFQDINRIQYNVIRLLAAPENNLFIVGDDDQSIYRFRGAVPEIMLGFEKDFPGCRRILLDVNYRSDEQILRAAGRIIVHNQARFSKDICASHPPVNPVVVTECRDVGDECREVISQIQDYQSQGMALDQIAILFRTNLEGRPFMDALMKHNLPFQMKDSVPNLFTGWIALDIRTYLSLVHQKRTRAAFLRIINKPKRYISRDAFPPFKEVSLNDFRQYYKDKDWMIDRIDRLDYDLNIMKDMSPFAAIHYIRKAMHYEDYLTEYAATRKIKPEELMEVLDQLQETSLNYKTVQDWEDYIRTYTEKLKEQNAHRREKLPYIQLCTLHSSKGLEFQTVFLPGINEGTIPHSKAVLDADIEEERRLLYVGMTRAKEHLHLSYLQEQYQKKKEPSRFLKELQPGPSKKERRT